MNARNILSPRILALFAAGAAAIAALASPAQAATTAAPAPGTYALKDGTTLYVADNGRMRMFTAEGQRLHMKDGVLMQTREGRIIAMKEDLNWKQLRQFGSLNPSPR
jgi:ketosteroid isomerase-like protein